MYGAHCSLVGTVQLNSMAYVSQKKIMFQSLIGTVQLHIFLIVYNNAVKFQSLIGTVQRTLWIAFDKVLECFNLS